MEKFGGKVVGKIMWKIQVEKVCGQMWWKNFVENWVKKLG